MEDETELVLSLYPNALGLGYACLAFPQSLKETGVIKITPIDNEKILEHVKKFIEFFKPHVIVVRDCDDQYSRNSGRTKQLTESITCYAKEMNIPVYGYSRQKIRDVFELFGAKTKYEIAAQIVKWFPKLEPRAPKIRKVWDKESYYMGTFDALALAITHRYLTE